MIWHCARLLARLYRIIDPYPAALELAAGLRADIRRLQAHLVEFRIALAEARVAATRRRRSSRSRRNGRAVGARVSAQH
jgi:hypothetical protein